MKLPGWKELLFAEVEAARDRPWGYGSHDCLQFAARCVLAQTGTDHAAQFDAYSDEAGAATVLAPYGSIRGLLMSLFGESVSRNEARTGDVVVGRYVGGEIAGVCVGPRCVFACAPQGVEYRDRDSVIAAFRID